MLIRTLLFTLLSVGIFSCAPSKLSVSKVSTSWELGYVYENEVNVTNRENPNRDRYITFDPSGTFISGGAPYGEITGTWKITEEGTLMIVPDEEGEVGSSEWKVSFDGDKMIWVGTYKSGLDRFKLNWNKK